MPSDGTRRGARPLCRGPRRRPADEALDPTERRARRASNTWYRELVDLVGDHLRITTPTMALWSGGFDVSVYARSKGHSPLEFTRLGAVVNQLELHADWKLQAPLWNVLSRAFVERATGHRWVLSRTLSSHPGEHGGGTPCDG